MSLIRAQFLIQGLGQVRLETEFEMADQGVTSLFGPSGAGKSTLLQALAGLIPPVESAGTHIATSYGVWQDPTQFIKPERRGIGMVFQKQLLFPHLTVAENIQYARNRRHDGPRFDDSTLIEIFELSHLMDRSPDQLSGGEAQRVALARTLANAPKLLLLDEPLAAVDRGTRANILNALTQIKSEYALPMLYVSHQWDEVIQLADHIQIIENGRIKRSETLTTLSADFDFVAQQEESAGAVLMTQVVKHHPEDALTEVELGRQTVLIPLLDMPTGATVRLLVHRQDVSLVKTPVLHSSILNTLACEVAELHVEQGACLLLLRCEKQYFTAKITARSQRILGLKPDQTIYAQIKATALAPLVRHHG
ncbi:MAG: molybdenum ABC transporter ATP-binding protein [Pseudomonadales bacterium]